MRGHRIEGADKVRGRAPFVDDLREAETGMTPLVTLVATAPNGSGRVLRVDAEAALAMPGTRAVIDHRNAPRLHTAKLLISMCEPGTRMPLQSDRIDYAGQAVALVVADTLQAARDGLAALRIDYEDGPAPAIDLDTGADRLAPVKRAGIAPGTSKKGDAQAALAGSDARVSIATHHAPHHPNPMEPGAVIARWDDDGGLTMHAAVQWHHLDTTMIAQAFGLGGFGGLLGRMVLKRRPKGPVRLTNQLSGGAFGRNISYQALLLAPMAAKVVGAPVKLVQTRRDTFSLMSHRAEVRQRITLGADHEGKLAAIDLEADVARGHAAFVEPVGQMPFQLYAHDAHRLATRVAPLDLPGAGWMRGPGVCHAVFALEQAMDALAAEREIDPLDLRLLNHAEVHPVSGKPWQAKALRDCYEQGAEAFGWRGRPAGGTRREDGRLMGFGMASSIDMGRQFPATAHVRLTTEGAVISCAVAEIGQGLLTGLTGLASRMLGLPPERIDVRHAGTAEGYAAGSIGSTGTYSNGAAIEAAVEVLRGRLAKAAGMPATARLEDGGLIAPDGRRAALPDLLAKTGPLEASGRAGLDFGARSKEAKASFGAVFCEMAADPLTLEVEIVRLVGAYDCGQVLQPRIVDAQLRGAMIMAMGQALMEETRLDRHTGHWTNAEIGEALVPTQADCPHIRAIAVGSQGDGPLDCKGIAETAMVGVAPAIASAFADATGGAVRNLPLTFEERLRAAPDLSRSTYKEAAE